MAETAGPREAIRDRALATGFDAIGFSDPELGDAARDALTGFLAAGKHGDMGWLAANAERRSSPRHLWPDTRTVISLAVNYGPSHDPLGELEPLRRNSRGNISVYARSRDYHDVLKSRLKALGRWIGESFSCEAKVFVDTAPVMEKPLAARAGVGWQGKHTNLVSRDYGSWLFLGEVYTDLAITPDDPEIDHCGSCRQCLDICPTDAFPTPYRLDARRCISYLTIEHKGHISQEFREPMGTRIYGCDDCLAVCPWNKYARPATEPALAPRTELEAPDLAMLAGLDDAAFRKLFSKSPIKRTGRDRFLRNVLIAAGNTGDAQLAATAEANLGDPSPLVRAMAVWALGRLAPRETFRRLHEREVATETDPAVIEEWRAASTGEAAP